jgi:hypothetical protein
MDPNPDPELDPDPYLWLVDPDSDPGDQKTRGSGTLLKISTSSNRVHSLKVTDNLCLFILFKWVTKDTSMTLSFLFIFNIKLFLYTDDTRDTGAFSLFSDWWIFEIIFVWWNYTPAYHCFQAFLPLEEEKNTVLPLIYRRGMIDGLLCTTHKIYFLSMYKANKDSNVSFPVSPVNHIVCL